MTIKDTCKSSSRRIASLPATKANQLLNFRRVNLQVCLWLAADLAGPDLRTGNILNFGWQWGKNGIPTPQLSSKPMAPPAILDGSSCGCKTGCGSNHCGCRRANQECTALCKCDCAKCTNRTLKATGDEVEDGDSDSDTDDEDIEKDDDDLYYDNVNIIGDKDCDYDDISDLDLEND